MAFALASLRKRSMQIGIKVRILWFCNVVSLFLMLQIVKSFKTKLQLGSSIAQLSF